MRRSLHSVLRNLLRFASLLALLAVATPLGAQQKGSQVPYASIGANHVNYAGPGRETSFDLPGPTIRIGLLAPVHGPQKADGEAIIAAARMALKDASKRPLPGGRHLALAIADESVPPWGLLGDEIIHLVMQKKVIAIVTCADGVAAHLSEQIGNKIGVSTLTLSGDDTATEINMPWIFRLGPSDTQQARVIAQNVYKVRGYQHVLFIAGRGHDGHIGSQEFIKAARLLGAPLPATLLINPLKPDANSVVAQIKAKVPQAIVFWTQPENAGKLIHVIRADGYHTPIYLSQQTAQEGSGLKFIQQNTGELKDPAGVDIYAVVSRQAKSPTRESFVRRYQRATGALPSPVAAEAYDAVTLVARAAREVGPNRARVRDQILTARNLVGVSGTITFDDQGNNRTKVYLVRLR